jgi:hypothetical protein
MHAWKELDPLKDDQKCEATLNGRYLKNLNPSEIGMWNVIYPFQTPLPTSSSSTLSTAPSIHIFLAKAQAVYRLSYL